MQLNESYPPSPVDASDFQSGVARTRRIQQSHEAMRKAKNYWKKQKERLRGN
jgi:hypothetical protein